MGDIEIRLAAIEAKVEQQDLQLVTLANLCNALAQGHVRVTEKQLEHGLQLAKMALEQERLAPDHK